MTAGSKIIYKVSETLFFYHSEKGSAKMECFLSIEYQVPGRR